MSKTPQLSISILLCFILLGCAGREAPTGSKNLDSYRTKIGKTAFNALNGVEMGKIVDVAMTQTNGSEQVLYKIDNQKRIINAPVSIVIVEDESLASAQDSMSVAEDAKVDPALGDVATEFQRRLAYYQGRLQSLTLEKGGIVAAWSSQKCNFFGAEVNHLVTGINRKYSGPVDSIEVKRTCDSTATELTISGSKYKQYTSGQIDDGQLLEGAK